MSLQDNRFQFFQRLAYGIGLTQDVDTVLVVFDHPAYSRNMPLNIREPFEHISPAIVFHYAFPFRPKRRNRNELLTTVNDDRAIAAAAKIGAFSRKNGMSGDRIAVGIKMTLYAKAQKRFCLMVRSVARESASAVATLFKFPLTSVISAASIAISVPVPIAMPASACTSAGASLMPSPAKATTRPRSCNFLTWLALSSGRTSAR